MKNMRKSRFFQKDAYISVDFLEKNVEVLQLEDIDGEADPFDIVLELGDNKGKKKILFDKPEVEETNAIQEELKAFYQCIVDDTTPIVSIEDGFHALEVAYQILEKIKGASSIM